MEMKVLSKGEVGIVMEDLKERFGFENVFDDYTFIESSKRRVYIVSKSVLPYLHSFRISTLGNLFCRMDKTIKPSTNMIQVFGKYATKSIVELNEDQVKQVVEGFDIEADGEDGYVILKYGNFFLGCGLLKEGNLKNMIPKAKRIKLDLF